MPLPLRPGLLPWLCLPLALPAQAPHFTIESQPEPPRPYRLFVGVDVRVLHENELHPVADFGNNRALLADPVQTEVPIDRLGAARFDHATKLGGLPVTITELAAKPSYARGNPRWDWMVAQSAVQGQVQDRLSIMEREISRASSLPTTAAMTTPDGNIVEASNPLADAVADYTQYAQQSAKLADSSFYAQKAAEAGGADTFDAVAVEALVSSPEPIVGAYAVGIARIRTDAAGYEDLIFFNQVDDLGPTPRRIRLQHEGLPPGFEIVSVDLHLYREGQELVSNRSEKQFALTREEALEYLTLERLSTHPGESLPPTPAWSLAPAALFAATDAAAFDRPLTVQVDERGRCLGLEQAASVPAHLAALAEQVLFLPALQHGQPVAATTTFNLRDFFR